MKKQFLFIGMAFCLASLSLTSCADTPAENRKEAKEDMKEAKEDLKDANQDAANAMRVERDELAARLDKAGRDLDAEIAELDRDIEKATAKEKAKWQERRKMLAAEREEIRSDTRRVGEDMKDGWNDFKMNTARRLDKISADLKADR